MAVLAFNPEFVPSKTLVPEGVVLVKLTGTPLQGYLDSTLGKTTYRVVYDNRAHDIYYQQGLFFLLTAKQTRLPISLKGVLALLQHQHKDNS